MTKFLDSYFEAKAIDNPTTRADKLRQKISEAGGIAYPVDEFDVPMLMMELQAVGLDLACDAWGSRPRKRFQSGSFHFYQDDYKFAGLLANPLQLVALQPRSAMELNISTDLNSPLAYLLGAIYAKRWVSRTWQSYGIRLWVDVNFAPSDREHTRYQMLGVPHGWRAYSTQGLANNVEYNIAQYHVACDRAGTKDILFAVIGGGRTLKKECAKRGWIWCPSVHERIKGNFEDEV